MIIDFNFRHFQASDELIEYVVGRFHKLGKWDRQSARATVVFSTQKNTMRVDVTIKGSGLNLHATGESPDFEASVDLVAERLERQLERRHSKRTEGRRNAG